MLKIVWLLVFVFILTGCYSRGVFMPLEEQGEQEEKSKQWPQQISEPQQQVQPEELGQLHKTAEMEKPQFISPLDEPEERIRLKKFGDYITPENSPVSPERFRGFHAGVDFEVFPEELNSAVAIKAGCDGKVLFKQWVSGYGGTVVTECELENKAVTVLYGHLSLTSISFQVGDFITAGDIIGYLGADNSEETDQERKHLHLSIHQGQTVNLRGYVNSEAELEDWLDPCDYICD